MANVTKWSNVAISMQSEIATAVNITAITKASQGVVTATNTYANGDYVLLTIQGMRQLNNKVARVSAVSGTGFTLEGIDTTEFDTFSTGTAKKITFGTTLGTVLGLTSSGGDFDFIDTTTIHDNQRTQIPGLPSPLTYTLDNIWDVSDAGLVAMKAASDAQSQRAFLITFANATKAVFSGYVGASLAPGGSAQDKVTTPATITAHGSPTYYTS
jgi:hypothetical protein